MFEAYDSRAEEPKRQPTLPRIASIKLDLDNETAQLLNTAEVAVRRMGDFRNTPLDPRVFADSCMLIESIADIKMNGKQLGVEHLFRNNVVQVMKTARDATSEKSETLRSTDALIATLQLGKQKITSATFGEIHRQLLTGTTRESFSGRLRTEEKQVGGSRYHSFGDPYLTPDPSLIGALLDDLAAFCNAETLPAVAQAALAHVQLIGIHPFTRANGKTARALIQLILSHRGLIAGPIAPLSVAMVVAPHDYQQGVIHTLKNFAQGNTDMHETNTWLRYFSANCILASETALSFGRNAADAQASWKKRVNARSDSAANLLMQALSAIPVFTANSASLYIDRSFKRTSTAIDELADAGVIVQITEGKRNRIFECPDIVRLYASIKGFQ